MTRDSRVRGGGVGYGFVVYSFGSFLRRFRVFIVAGCE